MTPTLTNTYLYGLASNVCFTPSYFLYKAVSRLSEATTCYVYYAVNIKLISGFLMLTEIERLTFTEIADLTRTRLIPRGRKNSDDNQDRND